jgi:hypothetical protein
VRVRIADGAKRGQVVQCELSPEATNPLSPEVLARIRRRDGSDRAACMHGLMTDFAGQARITSTPRMGARGEAEGGGFDVTFLQEGGARLSGLPREVSPPFRCSHQSLARWRLRWLLPLCLRGSRCAPSL